MAEKTCSGCTGCSWETITAEGAALLDKLTEVIHAGNIRRVVVEHQGRTVAEFPLTAGVVGVVVAPVLAAIGALIALLQECTVRIERERETGAAPLRDRTGEKTPTVA